MLNHPIARSQKFPEQPVSLSAQNMVFVQSIRFEYASYLDEHTPGWRDGKEAFGREGRGYTDAKIVRQDGRDYLLMKEYLIVTAATYGQIGYACLLFDWDENGDAYVKDFYVEPF